NDRRLKMVLPVENKRILVGEAAYGLLIVRGRDELTARLERFAQRQHKVSNLGQRKIIVRFIPETKHRAIGFVRGKHQSTYHETFFTVSQILKRNAYAALAIGELDDKASRVFANHRILDVFQVGHYLLEIIFALGISSRCVSQEA